MVHNLTNRMDPSPGEESLCKLTIKPISEVDLENAAARLKSRGDAGGSGDNIFEILPRVSISGGDDESWLQDYRENRDRVLGLTGGGDGDVTAVAIGSDLMVFDKDKDEPIKKMHFQSNIDFIVWRRSIILVGLSSSELILVDPVHYTIKYAWEQAQEVESNQKYFVNAFIHSNPDPTKMDVIVVSVNGLVTVIRNITLAGGQMDVTFDQNISLDIDLGTISDISTISLDINSEIVSVSSPFRNTVIVVEKCGQIMSVDLTEDEFPSTSVNANILYKTSLKNNVCPKTVVCFDGLIFVLLSNGVLQIFSGIDMHLAANLNLPISTSHVHDFKLILNDNDASVKLWVLYGDPSGEENYLGIFKGPQFSAEFIFQLPLLENKGSQYKFPANVSPFEEPNVIVEVSSNEVLLHRIIETSTDVTLQKLLARRKYAEALQLATNYKKNLDVVRKAQARDKLNKIIMHSTDEYASIESDYRSLKDILRSITDAEFVCNFCVVEAHLQKLEWVKEILGLGKERVFECSNTTAAKTLLLTLKKMYTFELVYVSGSIAEWMAFISEDNTMFIQSIKFLQNGNFDKCERIWTRHSDEFVSTLTLKDFLPFFNILFDHQLITSASVSLIKTIMPFAVEKVADSMFSSPHQGNHQPVDDSESHEFGVFISIIMRQVTSLEGKVAWPLNALKFIKELISVIQDEIRRLQNCKSEKPRILQQKLTIVGKIRSKLNQVEQVLVELAELKKNHSIRILFDDYTKNDISEVVNKLLGTLLRKEEVEHFVSKYFVPYAHRKNLDVDLLFSEHINSVLQKLHYYIQASNIPHEERIVCLVQLMSSTTRKLECTLEISKEWPVPWTAGIDKLVKQVLDSFQRGALSPECAKLYDNICLMRKQVPYRCVVNKYQLNGSKLLVSSSNVIMALLKILKLKKPGYYDDCKELLKNVNSNSFLHEIRLEYLEFTLKLYNPDISEEDIVTGDSKQKMNFKKAIIHRMEIELESAQDIDEFENFYSNEDVQRFINIYRYLAADSDDPDKSVVAKLLQLIPRAKLDAIHEVNFPFSVLPLLLEDLENYSKSFPELLADCKKLSKITGIYLQDILLAVTYFFNQVQGPGQSRASVFVWNIIEHVVKSPLGVNLNNSSLSEDLLQNASFEIASTLMFQCPELSLQQMEILHQFMCQILVSFGELIENISQQLCFYRIFYNLKEQEIPLEHDFVEIYKWLSGEQKSWDLIKTKCKHIGETLIKFGEIDLYSSIFKAIHRRLQALLQTLKIKDNVTARNYYIKIIQEIAAIKADLLSHSPRIPFEESDCSHLQNLVPGLNEAGIRVNLYALQQRNKVKMLERLLDSSNFALAADLAIAFGLYGQHTIWSQILIGCTSLNDLYELRRILETIRNVPELWMLPEFAKAWKKVSEVDNNFLHLCPIPLD